MGSFTSRDFVDLMEEEEIPNTPISNKRLVGLDPRSPTCGIDRTPIQVEKTPEKLDDPRSPTVGISRTPIVNASSDDSNNTSETSGVSSLNISDGSNCSLSDIQPLSIQAALDSLPPLDLDYEDDPYTEDIVERIPPPPDSPVIIGKKEFTPKVIIKSRTKSASFQVHSDGNDNSTEVIKSPLRVMPDGVQRSPLGKRNIDVSSPRHIMQRKQANKLDLLKAATNTPGKGAKVNTPCGLETLSIEDKENMSL